MAETNWTYRRRPNYPKTCRQSWNQSGSLPRNFDGELEHALQSLYQHSWQTMKKKNVRTLVSNSVQKLMRMSVLFLRSWHVTKDGFTSMNQKRKSNTDSGSVQSSQVKESASSSELNKKQTLCVFWHKIDIIGNLSFLMLQFILTFSAML